MNNFEFYNPVRICFGKGEIAKLSKLVSKGANILLAYGGGSIKRNGVYDQVIAALKGFKIIEFGGIEANPHYETLMKAVAVVKEHKIDFLLAVGGGSVLDGTKFIAAAALWEGSDPWEILSRRGEVNVEKALPIGTVLTLPATGSEMNGNSVVTRWETHDKLAFASDHVLPVFSILDPEVVFSLPQIQVANGIVDAFIHVMEQYLTYPVNAPIQDRFAESILTTLIEEGPKVFADRSSYDAAANFMWAATMALNGLIGVGVPQDWATHMIGHELTAFHGIDHGQTLCIVLPGIMKLKRENKKEKILQYGERVWKITKGNADERIDATIQKTIEFFESVGIKTKLADYGVGSEIIPKVVNRFIERGIKVIGERGDLTTDDIAKILEMQLK
ncbi:MAG: iron-containing alcohol dehydrogenase [Bacteroidia bacterium]|nr:iron-containing alcohol dehydrogenase [Bacteroidia bacterium]